MTAILMTGGHLQRKLIDALGDDPVTSALGATAPANEVVLLTFEGLPFNRVQERTRVIREVAVTLPDLWELRQNLDTILAEAVAHGDLILP